MNIERYQIVKAINTKEGLIPIWDSRITFQEDDVVGQSISVKGDTLFKEYFSLLECIYDLKTRELNVGIEINVYPDENKLAFKKGESVFYEQSHKVISEAKISDIVYEEYDLKILRGKKVLSYIIAGLYSVRQPYINTHVISRFYRVLKNILNLFLNFVFCIHKSFIFV